jgi:hypothetical protein
MTENKDFYNYTLMNKILRVSILLISEQFIYNTTGVVYSCYRDLIDLVSITLAFVFTCKHIFQLDHFIWVHYSNDLPVVLVDYIECLNFMKERVKPDVTERYG